MSTWSRLCVVAALTGLAVVLAAPSGLPAAVEDEAKLKEALQAAAAWQFGADPGPLNQVNAEVVQAAADPAERKAMEGRLIEALGKATTRGGKDFLCRQLVLVGSERCVGSLAGLLGDKESSHMARYVLERLPGPAAERALLDALGKVDDAQKIGILSSLGRRGDGAAADAIAGQLSSGDADVVAAALAALGRVDSDKATPAIAAARAKATGEMRLVADDAYLRCAARLARSGKADEAAAIYRKLLAGDESRMCRVAALGGLIAAQPDQAMGLAIATLSDKDEKVREVAGPLLRDVPGPAATQAIAAALPRQDEKVQALLVLVLGDRGDKAGLPTVVRAAGSGSEAVRLAALEALGKLGDPTVVALLLGRASAGDKDEKAARESIVALSGEGINEAIAVQLGAAGDAKVRAEAARSLAAREAVGSVPALIKAAGDPDKTVRAEVMKALKSLAGAEQTPVLVELLVKTDDDSVRAEAESAVVNAARQIAAPASQAAAPLAALAKTRGAPVRASLLRVLGRIGDDAALPGLLAAIKDPDADVRAEAIRALADWPNARPIGALLALASDKSASAAHRVLGLRGYINLIGLQGQATDVQILDAYENAIALAARPQEKQLVLARLSGLRHRRALKIAQGLQLDAALEAAAKAAARKIELLLSQPGRVSASHGQDSVQNAIDGKADTRWTTGSAMAGGEWFRIDLDEPRMIHGLVLDCNGSPSDYPRSYEVYVSTGSLGQGRLVAKGQGKGPLTRITFAPVVGQSVKIVQTGRTGGLFWSIHKLEVLSEPAGR